MTRYTDITQLSYATSQRNINITAFYVCCLHSVDKCIWCDQSVHIMRDTNYYSNSLTGLIFFYQHPNIINMTMHLFSKSAQFVLASSIYIDMHDRCVLLR